MLIEKKNNTYFNDLLQVCFLGALATVIVWRHVMKAEEKGYKHDKGSFEIACKYSSAGGTCLV